MAKVLLALAISQMPSVLAIGTITCGGIVGAIGQGATELAPAAGLHTLLPLGVQVEARVT